MNKLGKPFLTQIDKHTRSCEISDNVLSKLDLYDEINKEVSYIIQCYVQEISNDILDILYFETWQTINNEIENEIKN
jgi:hypothetical protein